MVQYKWIALSNTTIGSLMASINMSILMVALPAIFVGININPLTSFQYLLWILFGYSIVTSTLLVACGRFSDMFGRVKLYNLGFLIFTIGSILLSIVPSGSGENGALMLIIFRIVQGVGGAFLFSNSPAIITDAFPDNERGKALGINSIAFLVGSTVGLVLGGILTIFDWHLIFLVSVPVGIIGTIWSYWKLKEQHKPKPKQKIDLLGNLSFAAGLILILLGITYGLTPNPPDVMGWTNPLVIAALLSGTISLIAFPFIERKAADPMFRLDLFKIRAFSAGIVASFLNFLARGGLMILLIILLQGIWLPLHGYSFEDAPFWAGIFMLPMTLGFALTGPLSGMLSDKYGARELTTGGMILTGLCLILLCFLPVNFDYLPFAIIIFIIGVSSGVFFSPNMSAMMGSVPPERRGVASGMIGTLNNFAQTISQGVFFTIIIIALNAILPIALSSAAITAGAPQIVANVLGATPATAAIFSAFLGYNPIGSILQTAGLIGITPPNVLSTLTAPSFFSNAISQPFMGALQQAFILSAGLCFLGAIFSAMRGKKPTSQQAQIKKEIPQASH